MDNKNKALMKFLTENFILSDEEFDNTQIEYDGDNRFTFGCYEYLVMTDEEADIACKEYIEDSLWAFNASFILNHLDIYDKHAEDALREMQHTLCESANPLIKAMIGDNLDGFVEDAISADGRGHFLASYDNEENEVKVDDIWYYIYRI